MEYAIVVLGIGVVTYLAASKQQVGPRAVPFIPMKPIVPPLIPSNPVVTMTLNPPHPPSSISYDSTIVMVNQRNGVFTIMQSGNYRIQLIGDNELKTVYLQKIGVGIVDYITTTNTATFEIKAMLNEAFYIFYVYGVKPKVYPTAKITVTSV